MVTDMLLKKYEELMKSEESGKGLFGMLRVDKY